jgi:hypothetical protein
VRNPPGRKCGLGSGFGLVLGLCVVAMTAGIGVSSAGAQDTRAMAGPGAKPQTSNGGLYYVDFRARTAASYGHAFVWFGREGQKKVEVAGLHPATDSVVPYLVGHVLPVPSETGASYGDLDPQYVTARFRVQMSEPEGRRVFAYIKHLQATSPLWNAVTYNCVSFISDIARNMGLQTPVSHMLYPEDWVNNLRQLNGGRQVVRLPSAQQPSGTREAVAR